MRRRNQGTEAYHQINGEELGPMRGREPDEVCLLLSPHGGQVLACLRPPQLPSPPSGSISHPSHFFSLFCTPSYISHIPQEPPSISQSQEVTCRMGVAGGYLPHGRGGGGRTVTLSSSSCSTWPKGPSGELKRHPLPEGIPSSPHQVEKAPLITFLSQSLGLFGHLPLADRVICFHLRVLCRIKNSLEPPT